MENGVTIRLATYRNGSDQSDRVGLVRDGRILGFPEGTTIVGLIGAGTGALTEAAERALARPDEQLEISEVELLAPVPTPPSVRDFLAFEEHARNARGADLDPGWYELPVFYFSNPAAVRGPFDEIEISPGSAMYDFELEVAAIVGPEGTNLTVAEAEGHIAGYSVLCDFSARDLQGREMRLGLGPAKGKDGATSLGPLLVTPDELEPYRSGKAFSLSMEVSVNGRRYGGGRLDEIYWSFGEMLSYASRGTKVVPGDVIGSGTVGTGCILERAVQGEGDRYPWLVPGDLVELTVEQLGTLRHRIVAARVLHELRQSSDT